MSVLGLNLGIELMQFAIILAMVPCLLILSQTGYYRFMRNGGAVLAAISALVWIGARRNASDEPNRPAPQVGTITAP
jgi:hypothetical protein